MILSGKEIVKHLGKEIIIEPFHPERVNPNSYNLSLHNELMVYDHNELDMAKPNPASTIYIPKSGYVLQPNKLYLGRTNEYTRTDGYIPCSKAGRLSAAWRLHPRHGRVRRRRLCRLLDAGNLLRPAYPHLSNVESARFTTTISTGNTIPINTVNTRTIRASSPVCSGKTLKR